MGSHALDALKIATVRFRMRTIDGGKLPAWLGSALRGAFGSALRKTTCTQKGKKCEDCMLRDTCVYSVLFESFLPDGAKRLKSQDKIPHPYILRPLQPGGGFRAGHELGFELSLIGKAVSFFEFVIAAVQKMGEQGMGEAHTNFELLSVHDSLDHDATLWDVNHGNKLAALPTPESVLDIGEKVPPSNKIQLNLMTPLILKKNGDLNMRPSFREISRSILGRISSLLFFHCDTDLEQYLDFRKVLQDAQSVKELEIKIHKETLKRWSNRQKKIIYLHGISGHLRYEGDSVEELWPYLLAGQYIHMGNSTVFGLGRYEIGS